MGGGGRKGWAGVTDSNSLLAGNSRVGLRQGKERIGKKQGGELSELDRNRQSIEMGGEKGPGHPNEREL